MRYQPRILTARGRKLLRQWRTQAEPEAITAAVEHTARRFGCSRSWVRVVALGEFFGIDVARYDDPKPARKRTR